MNHLTDTNYIKKVKNFLLDMDGTLYLGNMVFECTPPFLDALRSSGKNILFLTNNSSFSVNEYIDKLAKMNISAKADEIFTSALATMIYLKDQTNYRKLFLMAVPSVQAEFEANGFVITNDTNEMPDALVLAFDKTLTYEKLTQATNFIMQGVPYIATHPDLVCPTQKLPIPDVGSIIELIKHATGGAVPKIIGKPNREMIESALAKIDGKACESAIVGDRLYTDMEMGFRAGLKTILVLSGESCEEDVIQAKKKPDHIINSVGDLTKWL